MAVTGRLTMCDEMKRWDGSALAHPAVSLQDEKAIKKALAFLLLTDVI